MNSYNQKLFLHPIKILLVFLIFTEVLFFVGPIKYDIRNPLIMVLCFVVLNLSLFWGYKFGVKHSRCTTYHIKENSVKVLLAIGLFLNIECMNVTWATHGMSFSFENLLFAIINPGDAYSGEATAPVNTNVITGIFLTPIRWAVIPLGVYYWKRLSKLFKFLVILTSLVYLFTWLGIGTRKGLMDIILLFYFCVIAMNSSFLSDPSLNRKLKLYAFSALILFLFFFIYSNASRSGLSDLNEISQMLNRDHREFYVKHCSPNTLAALSEITNYLCQGYYALNLSLSEIGIIPPTIGGSSMAMWNYLDRFFGFNPMPNTYMSILDSFYGIDTYVNWHTIYLWIANDVTFIFVPLVIFLIGLYFGRVWKDSLNGINPWAYPVLGFMAIMVFYFFANNQVLSFSLEAFTGCVLIYEYTRLRHKIR